MKMKKILAAIAASTMAIAMLSISASAAGTDAEEDIIEDTDVVEEVVGDDEEEIVADEEPAEEIVVVEETTNPGTGNAPIALAVIPVALAAAAVVAKKIK